MMVWRHSSAPVAPASLTTVKSVKVPVLTVEPAATTSPRASTVTAKANSKSFAVPLIFVCQPQAPDDKNSRADAPSKPSLSSFMSPSFRSHDLATDGPARSGATRPAPPPFPPGPARTGRQTTQYTCTRVFLIEPRQWQQGP